MKKLIAKLLTIVLLVTMVACSTSTDTTNETKETEKTQDSAKQETSLPTSNTKPGPWGKYDPPITITYAQVISSTMLDRLAQLNEITGENYSEDDTMWTRAYYDEFGITMKMAFSAANHDEYITQLSVAAASNQLPDYIQFGDNKAVIGQFYQAGSLADLTDVIEQYAYPFYKNSLEQAGEEIFYAGTFNGRRHVLPQIIGGENSAQAFIYIRKDWLDKLGMEIPDTMEELVAVIKAFKDNDPDGNGKNDTIGLLAYDTSIPGMFKGFFNAFHAYPDAWVKDGKGGITYGSILDENKAALAQLAELYAGGYIPQDWFSLTYDSAKERVVTGKAGLMFGTQSQMFGMYQDVWENLKDEGVEFWVIPIPSVDGKLPKFTASSNAQNYYGMSSSCKYPEVIVKFANLHVKYLWDPEYTNAELSAKYGNYPASDKHAGVTDLWSLSLVPYELPGKNAEKNRLAFEAIKTGDTSKLILPEYITLYEFLKQIDENKENKLKDIEITFGRHGANVVMEKYLKNGQIMTDLFLGAPTKTMISSQAALDTMEQEAFTNIIAGNKPVDYFDTFVKEWMAAGGQQIINEVNEWYKGIFAK